MWVGKQRQLAKGRVVVYTPQPLVTRKAVTSVPRQRHVEISARKIELKLEPSKTFDRWMSWAPKTVIVASAVTPGWPAAENRPHPASMYSNVRHCIVKKEFRRK